MRRVKFEIDENDKITGVKTMSIVDKPAIQSEFIAFSAEKPLVELKAEGYKQVLAGQALVPDRDIIRTDESGQPYIAYFTPEGIEKIRNKFHKEMMTDKVNVDHKRTGYIDAYLIESFIIDSQERLADVTAKGITDATMGSWFVAYKVEDPETFSRALKGELRGFSVEIFVNKAFRAETPTVRDDRTVMRKKLMESKIQLINSYGN